MKIEQFNFAGKKAIVRVDFNVPLDENGNVTDDTRIRGALPTLKKILADGGSVIMMSHMGKPKGKVNPKLSLSQIVKNVSEHLGVEVKFAPDCANADNEAAALKPGEALLLENLRFYPEEEGKPVGIDKADPAYDEAKKEMKTRQQAFAKKLASYADCYVMDAFGTAHRKHASTAVIDEYFDKDSKMLGYLMEKEVKAVDNVLSNIKRPFTAIMGGSKVSTKIGIIENLLGKVDNLILCGGMTYTTSCSARTAELPTTSPTTQTPRFAPPTTSPTDGKASTPAPIRARLSPKPSRAQRQSFGTAPQAYSSLTTSSAARRPSQTP